MRKVDKNHLRPPRSLERTDAHNKKLIRIFNGTGVPNTSLIYGYIYAADDVRRKLAALYYDKCAYCETKDYEFEVEHYRPKKSVDGEIHDGYFWLCYEWTNLIPACHDCNKTKSKSTKFPIAGMRINQPVIIKGKYQFSDHLLHTGSLARELPLLIHPEESDFEARTYFKFESDGWMVPASRKSTFKYRRAKETIDEIVRLNRDNLYLNRRSSDLRNYRKRLVGIYFLYLLNFRKYGSAIAEDNLSKSFFDLLDEIKERKKPQNEYSFFWDYVYDNFYDFLPAKLRKRPKDKTRFHKLIVDYRLLNNK